MAPPSPRAAQPRGGARAARVTRWILVHVLRALWLSTMVLTPLFGFWLASSLAAYQNASQWLALLGGLLLFPLIPAGWEGFYAWRRSRHEVPRKQILTRVDRLVLRTLIINGLFLAGMMWLGRATAFRSLAVRGDWMLDGHDGPIASTMRGWLLGFADRFDRRTPEDEPYGKSDEAPDPSTIKRRDDREPNPRKPGEVQPPKDWPLPDEADPKVSAMPESAQTTIDTVGAYLKEQFPDKKQRVKAIHDYVALRLTYDDEALAKIIAHDYKDLPSQQAEPVFAARKAVCEGYSRLMIALGKAANIEIAYVSGYIRDASRRLAGIDDPIKASLQGVLHAWNAVLLDDEWLLIDSTWDDPTGATEPVRSTYLFTPPKLFAYDHHPEDPAWQLVMSPISLGDFTRQPLLSPTIGRFGIVLESPTRSQVTVRGEVEIVLANPYNARMSAYAKLDGSGKGGAQIRCTVAEQPGSRSAITCDLGRGEYEVSMFAAPASNDAGGYTLDYIGSILVNSR